MPCKTKSEGRTVLASHACSASDDDDDAVATSTSTAVTASTPTGTHGTPFLGIANASSGYAPSGRGSALSSFLSMFIRGGGRKAGGGRINVVSRLSAVSTATGGGRDVEVPEWCAEEKQLFADLAVQTLDVSRVLRAAVAARKSMNVEATVLSITSWVNINSKDRRVRQADGREGGRGKIELVIDF